MLSTTTKKTQHLREKEQEKKTQHLTWIDNAYKMSADLTKLY
jgi:hypothetical protein